MDNQILDENFRNTNFDTETVKKINLLKIDVDNNIKDIRNGRIALIVLFFFVIMSMIIGLTLNPVEATPLEVTIEGVVLMALYAMAAWAVPVKPKAALIVGLCTYLLVQLLYVLVEPSSIYQGIIVKAIIIYFLAKAISASFHFEKNIDQLMRLGVPHEEIDTMRALRQAPKTVYPVEGDG